jgi:hypothetical protein
MAPPGRFSLGGHAATSTWLHRPIAAALPDQETSQNQIRNARYITLFSDARNNRRIVTSGMDTAEMSGCSVKYHWRCGFTISDP